MTYGEAHTVEKESLQLVKGKWVQSVLIKNKPKPMQKNEASKYYNKKLFNYWLGFLDDRVKKERKERLLSALMFNNTEAYMHKIGKEE